MAFSVLGLRIEPVKCTPKKIKTQFGIIVFLELSTNYNVIIHCATMSSLAFAGIPYLLKKRKNILWQKGVKIFLHKSFLHRF